MNIRSWIRRQPQPTRIRADGREIRIGTGGRKWSDLLETLEGLHVKRLEAIDESGAVLRACDLDEAEEEEEAAEVPRGGPLNELGTVVEVARLLSEHADRAAMRHEAAYRYGFDTLSGIVQMLAARLTVIETAWHKTVVATAEAHAAAAEEGDGGGAMLQLLAPMLGSVVPKSTPKPNGKGGVT